MGLDLRLHHPTNEEESQFFFGTSVMRTVKDMEHYCLVATSGKTLKEVKFDMLKHISEMMQQIDTYAYIPTQSRHDMRVCNDQEITLQSDLEIIGHLVGELVETGVPDDWIVEWDY